MMIFEDLYYFLGSKNNKGNNDTIIDNTNFSDEFTPLQSYSVSYKLLKNAAKREKTFALLRLGDYHYYGKISKESDYPKAYGFYKRAIWTNSSAEFKAQAYLSLGYMHHFGIGAEKSRQKATEYYSKVKIFILNF